MIKQSKGLNMLINNKLSKSIVFKYHLLAIEVNKRFEDIHNIHVDSDIIEEFPYYKNLQGLPHELNSKIVTNNISDNEEITLTKDSLHNEYKDLLLELRKCDVEYDKLMKAYENDGTYIHGMIFPVTMEKIKESPDGTILNYNNDFIESNEVSLLNKLESSLYKFLFANSNPQYVITDNLYATIVYTMACGFIESEIARLRIYAIDTFEARKEYKLEKLNGHFRLGAYATRLNEQSLLWLYKNIDFLNINAGKNIVLDRLIKEVVISNGLSIDKIFVNSIDTEIITGIPIDKLPLKFNGSPVKRSLVNIDTVETDYLTFKRRQYDSSLSNNSQISTSYLRELELKNNPKGTHPIILNNELIDANGITKNLLLSHTSGKINSVDILTITIETMLMFIHSNTSIVDIKDSIGNITSMKPDILRIKYIALLLDMIGGDKFDNIRIINLLDKTTPHTKLISNLSLPENFDTKVIDSLVPLTSTPSDIVPSQIKTLEMITQVYNDDRLGTFERADVDLYTARLKSKIILNFNTMFNGKTIEQLKLENNITITDTIKEFVSITESVTSINLLKHDDINLLINDIKEILSRLTSYTTQILVDVDNNVITIDKPYNGIMHGDGYLKLTNGEILLSKSIPTINNPVSTELSPHTVTYDSNMDTYIDTPHVYGVIEDYNVSYTNNLIVEI